MDRRPSRRADAGALGEPDYPALLSTLPDAPPALWVYGTSALLRRPALAIVGARNASAAGLRMARELGRDLAEAGFVICSGLARGIDCAAHEAAGPARTIAVVAGGADVPHSADTRPLAEAIAREGAVISEQPPGMRPIARHFPLRNRIISGLSGAVVVVEATSQSGSLITAKNALDQGREVLAVPGHPLDPRAAGCNLLLRDGAVLVRHSGDVTDVTGRPPRALPPAALALPPWGEGAALARRMAGVARAALPARQMRERLLALLSPAPVAEEEVLRELGLAAADLAPLLLTLELEDRITRHPGGWLSRAGGGDKAPAA